MTTVTIIVRLPGHEDSVAAVMAEDMPEDEFAEFVAREAAIVARGLWAAT